MKMLIMAEVKGGEMYAAARENARRIGNFDIVEGQWYEPEMGNLTSTIRRLEVEGPNHMPVPRDFVSNPDTEILVGSFCPFSGAGMDAIPSLKLIGVIRAGLENIDVEAATKRGILVVNATGRNANAVSDFTIGLMLAEARNIARSHYAIMTGGYREAFPNRAFTPDMYGKTVGLFGFGYIGKLVAEKLSGFKMRVLAHDPYVRQEDVDQYGVTLVDKETLFKEADFLSINARLTDETYHIVGAKEIGLMKKTAVFINTARSGLVDYDALAEALIERRIAGAGLDVFDDEPIPQDSPYLKMDNVTLTAHLAGSTLDATLRSPELLIERVANAIKGESMDGVVNREVMVSPAFKEWLEKARKYVK